MQAIKSIMALLLRSRCNFFSLLQVADDPNLGDCPRLGDEPSFMQEQKKKVDVPGHRDTKDVLAQLTTEKKKDEKKLAKHSLYQ